MKTLKKYLTIFWAVLGFAAPVHAAPELQLSDLGLSKEAVAPDYKLQRKIEKRASFLKYHQYFALGALATMTGAVLSARENQQATDLHAGLGIASGVLYMTAASFALLAPELNDNQEKNVSNNVKWHKRLAWIHVPALIIGPILGIIANNDYKHGKKPGGLAKLHAPLVTAGFIAYALSASLMTFEF